MLNRRLLSKSNDVVVFEPEKYTYTCDAASNTISINVTSTINDENIDVTVTGNDIFNVSVTKASTTSSYTHVVKLTTGVNTDENNTKTYTILLIQEKSGELKTVTVVQEKDKVYNSMVYLDNPVFSINRDSSQYNTNGGLWFNMSGTNDSIGMSTFLKWYAGASLFNVEWESASSVSYWYSGRVTTESISHDAGFMDGSYTAGYCSITDTKPSSSVTEIKNIVITLVGANGKNVYANVLMDIYILYDENAGTITATLLVTSILQLDVGDAIVPSGETKATFVVPALKGVYTNISHQDMVQKYLQ